MPARFSLPVGQVEAGGRDDVDRNGKAGAESEDRAGVLRDVWLIECEDHRKTGGRRCAGGNMAWRNRHRHKKVKVESSGIG